MVKGYQAEIPALSFTNLVALNKFSLPCLDFPKILTYRMVKITRKIYFQHLLSVRALHVGAV